MTDAEHPLATGDANDKRIIASLTTTDEQTYIAVEQSREIPSHCTCVIAVGGVTHGFPLPLPSATRLARALKVFSAPQTRTEAPGSRQPFTCPVCHGTGAVMMQSNDTKTLYCSPLDCHACQGKGIVWG